MSYYVLKCYPTNTDAVISNEPNLPKPLSLWNSGHRFDLPIPTPLNYSIEEEDAGEMLPLFDTGAHLLMRIDLVEALNAAGIDNFDIYDAIIDDQKSGIRFTNYRAINIIGAISATEKSKSSGEDVGLVDNGLVTMWFDKLSIDETKTKGALMFRLAENVSYILIHESVKRLLVQQGYARLSFIQPEDI